MLLSRDATASAIESVRPVLTIDSRKVKFSAATVVDNFARFRARSVLRGLTTLAAFRIGCSLEGMAATPLLFYHPIHHPYRRTINVLN